MMQYDLLFGNYSVVFANPRPVGPIKETAFILYNNSNTHLPIIFLVGLLLLSVFKLLKRGPYLVPDFIIWLLVINIQFKIYAAITGGDNLLVQLLFFNCFLSDDFRTHGNIKHSVKKGLHNFSLIAVIIQICLVYFVSAVAKLSDAAWISGKALEMISHISHFSMYTFPSRTDNLPIFLVALNYLVLFYQLFFPLMVFWRQIKLPYLMLGVLMHIYISLVMGLVTFGMIMIISYVLFLPFVIRAYWPFKLLDIANSEK
jgi:hypothetical protein